MVVDELNDPHIYTFTNLPSSNSNYKTYYLRLYIALKLLIESSNICIAGYAETGDVVAAEGVDRLGIHIFVVSDGSIFLTGSRGCYE